MANPFRYQGPIPPDRLIDRADELDALQRAAGDRVAIRLAAPRRFGKTSLLDAHIDSMRAVGHRAVRVDFSKVASVSDAAVRTARAFSELPADPQQTLHRLLQRFGITVGPGGLSVSLLAPAARTGMGVDEARQLLAELLDVPAALHAADGELTVVCLDEFQDLLVADDHLDGLIRSVIQHHGEAAAYVYAGSAPSMMRALFDDRERPFYGQARPLALPPLPAAETVEDIGRILQADGLPVTASVSEIVAIGAGHPQRTMLLAHHLYDLLAAGEPPEGAASLALERALEEVADALQAAWDGLDRTARIVLVALAEGKAPTGSRLAQEHGVARSTLKKALDRLADAEQHVVRDDRPVLLDPLLAEWLRRR
jgi:uncharacterized protein